MSHDLLCGITDFPSLSCLCRRCFSSLRLTNIPPLHVAWIVLPAVAQEYIALLKSVFDFPRIAALLARPDFSFVFDGMNGVAGVYASRVFVDELGASSESLLRCRGWGRTHAPQGGTRPVGVEKGRFLPPPLALVGGIGSWLVEAAAHGERRPPPWFPLCRADRVV